MRMQRVIRKGEVKRPIKAKDEADVCADPYEFDQYFILFAKEFKAQNKVSNILVLISFQPSFVATKQTKHVVSKWRETKGGLEATLFYFFPIIDLLSFIIIIHPLFSL